MTSKPASRYTRSGQLSRRSLSPETRARLQAQEAAKAERNAKTYADSQKATFWFVERDTNSQGVVELSIEDSHRHFQFAHTGWANGILRDAGQYYIAEQILSQIGGAADTFRAAITYGTGPKGRRFVRLTDEVIDAIDREGNPANKRNNREAARAHEVKAFAIALLALTMGEPSIVKSF